MTKQKIIIGALIAILAISLPLTIQGVRDTWIGIDCEDVNDRNLPTCKDVNALDIRVLALEPVSEIQFQVTPEEAIAAEIGEYVYIVGQVPYVVEESSISWTVYDTEDQIIRGGSKTTDYDGRFVSSLRTDADEYPVVGSYTIVLEYNGMNSTAILEVTEVLP